jgi:hypothetical protein
MASYLIVFVEEGPVILLRSNYYPMEEDCSDSFGLKADRDTVLARNRYVSG